MAEVSVGFAVGVLRIMLCVVEFNVPTKEAVLLPLVPVLLPFTKDTASPALVCIDPIAVALPVIVLFVEFVTFVAFIAFVAFVA
jgi:hypothetical protein